MNIYLELNIKLQQRMGFTQTWNLYISPLRTLLSTVPPKMYMASWITAAAWKSRPLGICGRETKNSLRTSEGIN